MKYLPLRYVQEIKDRYGKKRYYFRRKGYPRITLSGAPGTREFEFSYHAAMSAAPQVVRPGKSRIASGTFADLFAQYFDSAEFHQLQPITQRNYRAILGRLSKLDDILVKDITRADILRIRDKGNTVSLMRRLKTLLNFAVERGFRDDNPADKVKIIGEKKPFRAWTEDDIITFAKHYQYDSREILALMLLLYTGARRSDVVTFGWHMVRGNTLSFIPRKTSYKQADPQPLYIPLHPRLIERLTLCPAEDPTFLMTEHGKSVSEFGFSGWFTEKARNAGLPHNSSPHGLRKAAARRLAEAGCSTHEIAAITGHASLKEVERYTQSVRQIKLAESAIGYISDDFVGPRL